MWITLLWKETGGPSVAVPMRVGFGTTLIRRTVAYELDGEAKLDYLPEGLVCTIGFPLRRNSAELLEEAVRTAAPAV